MLDVSRQIGAAMTDDEDCSYQDGNLYDAREEENRCHECDRRCGLAYLCADCSESEKREKHFSDLNKKDVQSE